jgi:radical SAM superfamily enzyme YgiQ (UPF0313 family)
LAVGIEKGSERILKMIHKNLNLVELPEKIKRIKKHGILVTGFFILGYPTETKKEILDTIHYAVAAPLDFANFMLFHPYEGTEAFEQAKLSRKQLTDATFAEVAYVPESLTKFQLKNLQRKAFLLFYLRPFNLLRLMRNIFRMPGKKFIFRRIIRWLF